MKGVYLAVIALLVVVGAVLTVRLSGENARLSVKAKKFDEVCLLAASSLRTDRSLLKSAKERDVMLANFAGNRIGDGYAMLEWCLPHAAESVAEIRRCQDDVGCLERALQAMEATINEGTAE